MVDGGKRWAIIDHFSHDAGVSSACTHGKKSFEIAVHLEAGAGGDGVDDHATARRRHAHLHRRVQRLLHSFMHARPYRRVEEAPARALG